MWIILWGNGGNVSPQQNKFSSADLCNRFKSLRQSHFTYLRNDELLLLMCLSAVLLKHESHNISFPFKQIVRQVQVVDRRSPDWVGGDVVILISRGLARRHLDSPRNSPVLAPSKASLKGEQQYERIRRMLTYHSWNGRLPWTGFWTHSLVLERRLQQKQQIQKLVLVVAGFNLETGDQRSKKRSTDAIWSQKIWCSTKKVMSYFNLQKNSIDIDGLITERVVRYSCQISKFRNIWQDLYQSWFHKISQISLKKSQKVPIWIRIFFKKGFL